MDLATLGLAVDSTPVEKANQNLDTLVTTGAKAEQSAQRIGASYSKAAREIEGQVTKMLAAQRAMVTQQERTNTLLVEMSTKLQRSSHDTDAAKSAADRFIASLTKQAATLGMNRTQLLAYEAAQLGVTDKAAPMIARLQAAEKQLTTTGSSARAAANNLRMLPAQMTDIAVGLSTGQSPFMVLMQQGGQLKDIFGGIGPAAKAVGGFVMGLVGPVTIAAAAVGGLATVYHLGSQEAKEYTRAIVLSGNAAGTTGGQMQEMAKHVSTVVGTQGKAAEVLTMMVTTGRIAADEMERFATMAVALDRVGVEAQDTVNDLAALGKSPVEAAGKLNESMNFLTGATYKQIKALSDLGQTDAAAELAQKTYAAAMEDRASRLEAQLGLVERSWLKVKDAAKFAWDSMLNVGRPSSVEEQLAAVQQQIDKARARFDPSAFGGNAEARAQLPNLQEQERRLQRMLEITNGNAAAQAKVAEQTRATVEFEKLQEQTLSRQEKIQRDIARARELGLKAGATAAEIEKTIANIAYETSKLGVEAQIERLQGIQQVLEVRTKNQIAEMEAQRKLGALNEVSFVEQVAAAELAAMAKRRALIEQQIALKATERDSEKEVAALRREIDVQDEQVSARKLQRNRDLVVLLYEREKASYAVIRAEQEQFQLEKAMEEVAASKRFEQAQLAQLAYAQSIRDANEQIDFEAASLGKTTAELARMNEQRRIELRLREEKRRTEERARGGNLTAEQVLELNQAAEVSAAEAIAKIDTKMYVDKWKAANQVVGDTLYDVLTDEGKNASDKLKKIFGDLVLRPLLQPIANSITNLVVGGSGGGSAGGAGGGSNPWANIIGGLFGTGERAGGYATTGGASGGGFNLGGLLGGAGGMGGSAGGWLGQISNFMGGSEGLVMGGLNGSGILGGIGTGLFGTAGAYAGGVAGLSAAGAGSQAAMLAAQTGTFGAAGLSATAAAGAGATGAAAAGGAGVGAGAGLAAAIPVIGWVVAIAALLYSIFGGKGGGPKAEGYYNPYNSDAYYSSNMPEVQSSAKGAAKALQAQYDSIAKAYGNSGGMQFGLGFSADPAGTANTMLHIGAGRAGQTQFNLHDESVGRDEEDLQKAIGEMGAQAILKGLQLSNLGGEIGKYLASLGDAARLAADSVQEAINRIQKATAEKMALDARWTALTTTEEQKREAAKKAELDSADRMNKAQVFRVQAMEDEVRLYEQARSKAAQWITVIESATASYNSFIDRLNATPAGMLAPEQQLANAQSQWVRELEKARDGDQKAMQTLAAFADQYITAQQSFTASNPATQAVIAGVKAALSELGAEMSTDEYLANAIDDSTNILNLTLQQLIERADANAAAMIAAYNASVGVDEQIGDGSVYAPLPASAYKPPTAAETAAARAQEPGAWFGVGSPYGMTPPGGWDAYLGTPAAAPAAPAPAVWYGIGSPYGMAPPGGWDAFDVGTNYVPYDMTAKIHEGERIVPKRDNPYAHPYTPDRAKQGDNTELVAVVKDLGSRLDRLCTVVAAGARGTIEGLDEVASNTSVSARAATLRAAEAPV